MAHPYTSIWNDTGTTEIKMAELEIGKDRPWTIPGFHRPISKDDALTRDVSVLSLWEASDL
jgi:hypothetical protein